MNEQTCELSFIDSAGRPLALWVVRTQLHGTLCGVGEMGERSKAPRSIRHLDTLLELRFGDCSRRTRWLTRVVTAVSCES